MVHVGIIGARKDNPGFFGMFTTAIYIFIYMVHFWIFEGCEARNLYTYMYGSFRGM